MALNEITVGVSEDWEEEQGLTPLRLPTLARWDNGEGNHEG